MPIFGDGVAGAEFVSEYPGHWHMAPLAMRKSATEVSGPSAGTPAERVRSVGWQRSELTVARFRRRFPPLDPKTRLAPGGISPVALAHTSLKRRSGGTEDQGRPSTDEKLSPAQPRGEVRYTSAVDA